MLSLNTTRAGRQRGFTLLEVLITMVILAFGLLGLVNLQGKLHLTESEAYQRAQAVVLLQDMSNRVRANYSQAASYVTDSPLGTGTTFVCLPLPATPVGLDKCNWSDRLKGSSETKAGANVGAMVDARGCVEQIQAPDGTAGICTPGVYRVTVAWQGLHETVEPDLTCGEDLYGGAAKEKYRRAISSVITVGLPRCT